MIEHLDNYEPLAGEDIAEQPEQTHEQGPSGDPAQPLNDLAQGQHFDEPEASEQAPAPAATAPPATESAPAPPVPPEADDEELRITANEALAPSRQLYSSPGPAADAGRQRRATVISFANQKGGVAKTTSTLNLAVAFAESGHQVLCVDLDPQGNLTMSQGIDPDSLDASMYDVLVHQLSI